MQDGTEPDDPFTRLPSCPRKLWDELGLPRLSCFLSYCPLIMHVLGNASAGLVYVLIYEFPETLWNLVH